jgi:hypothetical protein
MRVKRLILLLTLLIAAGAVLLASTQAFASYQSDLVGYWKFDETSGTTAYDSTGNQNGLIQNGVAINQTGKCGRAYSFDGINDRVTVTNNSSQDLSQNFTVSLWMYTTDNTTNNMGVLLKGSSGFDSGGTGIEMRLRLFVHPEKVEFGRGIGSGTPARLSGFRNLTSKWTNLAVTYNYSTGYSYLYIDGQYVSYMAYSGTYSDTYNLIIGRGLDTVFNGLIDDVSIWNQYKSAAQMYDLYVNGAQPIDETSRETDLDTYLDTAAISLTQSQLDNLTYAVLNDTAGTKRPISELISHYEPLLLGSGTSENPYYYSFSSFTDLAANYWAWGTGDLTDYSSLDNWYSQASIGSLITKDGDSTIEGNESWFLKTGGGVGDMTPEPASAFALVVAIGWAWLKAKKEKKWTK